MKNCIEFLWAIKEILESNDIDRYGEEGWAGPVDYDEALWIRESIMDIARLVREREEKELKND